MFGFYNGLSSTEKLAWLGLSLSKYLIIALVVVAKSNAGNYISSEKEFSGKGFVLAEEHVKQKLIEESNGKTSFALLMDKT